MVRPRQFFRQRSQSTDGMTDIGTALHARIVAESFRHETGRRHGPLDIEQLPLPDQRNRRHSQRSLRADQVQYRVNQFLFIPQIVIKRIPAAMDKQVAPPSDSEAFQNIDNILRTILPAMEEGAIFYVPILADQ